MTASRKVGNFAPTLPPRPAPDAPFLEDGTVPRTLADFRGKGLVLNLWATWCAPCVFEMPSLNRLQAELADEGVVVLALSEDIGGADRVKRFYGRRGIANLAVHIDERGRMFNALGAQGLPTTVLVDAMGREVGRVLGPLEWDTPEAIDFVRACLAVKDSR